MWFGEPTLGPEIIIPRISRRPAGQECGWGANARAELIIPIISRRPAGQECGSGANARAGRIHSLTQHTH